MVLHNQVWIQMDFIWFFSIIIIEYPFFRNVKAGAIFVHFQTNLQELLVMPRKVLNSA